MPILYDDFGGSEKQPQDHNDDSIEIFLDPGEYFVGDESFSVRTLLGSCVSITLWHPRLRFGAMCHFLLSARPVSNPANSGIGAGIIGFNDRRSERRGAELDGKYADEVLLLMMRELMQAQVPIQQCKAKIFGGGNMFPQRRQEDRFNVGLKNGETARQLLKAHGIPIVSEDLFGDGHREVIFSVASGDVWIRQVKPNP